jgi:hypothetical protein
VRAIAPEVRLVAEPSIGSNRSQCGEPELSKETYAVEIELKRAARNVIERIVNLRDSL